MAEERVVERTDGMGNVTERTVERTVGGSGNGAGGVLWMIVALIAIGVAAFLFTNINKSESKKDDAVAAAAGQVGDAAQQVGDAAKKAGDELTK